MGQSIAFKFFLLTPCSLELIVVILLLVASLYNKICVLLQLPAAAADFDDCDDERWFTGNS